MQFVSKSLKETRQFAEQLVSLLKQTYQNSSGAVVLTLSGDLGAGKTTLTKFLAEILGVSTSVTSPTFILRSDYETEDLVFSNISHFDAYRLDSEDEILTAGWKEVLSEQGVLIILEWPERVSRHVPEDAFPVVIKAVDSTHTFSFPSV